MCETSDYEDFVGISISIHDKINYFGFFFFDCSCTISVKFDGLLMHVSRVSSVSLLKYIQTSLLHPILHQALSFVKIQLPFLLL